MACSGLEVTNDSNESCDKPVISLSSVSCGYAKGVPVIRDMTAALSPGRLCALIGPNAAGKSTVIRVILGQLAAWSGEVRLGEVDPSILSSVERASRMSYVPQRSSCGFAFTVEQVVQMGRFMILPDAHVTECVLDICDLKEIRRRIFSQLSVGQQQRVLLARAMAQIWRSEDREAHSGEGKHMSSGAFSGRVMLLDEPVSAMDLWHAHRTMQTLASLVARGLTVLTVLHDLNLVLRYCDDVWLLDGGGLVAAGPWDQVMEGKRLESVYHVPIRMQEIGLGERPVLHVVSSATMKGGGEARTV